MIQKKIKILIVDDSPTARELLSFIITGDPQLSVLGFSSDGKEALHSIQKEPPDVILMDIMMPVMDGLEATRRIMQTCPTPIIIVSSKYRKTDESLSIEALDAGALAIIEKPLGLTHPSFRENANEIIKLIKRLSEVKLVTRQFSSDSVSPSSANAFSSYHLPKNIASIAIGASLGGPQALMHIFSKLPKHFPVPIFVVQHITAGFLEGLVDWLNKNSELTITIAHHLLKPLPGHIYFAPSNSHLELYPNGHFRLVNDVDKSGALPSIGRLFRSVAEVYGSKAIGILLTGMGRDGAEDLLVMKEKGSYTIAQDQESSLVFGMPKEAISLGAALKVFSLEEITLFLQNFAKANKRLT